MPRERFEQELVRLGSSTLVLGEQASTAVQQATQALLEQNVQLAERVITEDAGINRMERAILDSAADLLVLQAPVASDLRRVLGISRVASNFERIGDHARDIARGIVRLGGAASVDPQGDLGMLIDGVQAMLREGLECFSLADVDRARTVRKAEDNVRSAYAALYRGILAQILAEPTMATRGTHTLFIGHDLERISDHVANVAETIVYMVTGNTVELN